MKVQLNTHITLELYQALDRYSAESGQSKASITAKALTEHLEKNGVKVEKSK